jgi:phytoene synthase
MDSYKTISRDLSRRLTKFYSTSFSMASRLFADSIRSDIYAIYALVRIADEIVDNYDGPHQKLLLSNLEHEVYQAMDIGYSANTVVHAFADVAIRFTINKELIHPFFESMTMDIEPAISLSQNRYLKYIYGSAEVVGLMCLKVFCEADQHKYEQLAPSASHLGAAYQKVNFLRDLADDYKLLGRYYFPIASFETFSEETKTEIITDIANDFSLALPGIRALPATARPAVYASYRYFTALLKKLDRTPVTRLKDSRVRIPNAIKLSLLAQSLIRSRLGWL